jgi:hypothetical protein
MRHDSIVSSSRIPQCENKFLLFCFTQAPQTITRTKPWNGLRLLPLESHLSSIRYQPPTSLRLHKLCTWKNTALNNITNIANSESNPHNSRQAVPMHRRCCHWWRHMLQYMFPIPHFTTLKATVIQVPDNMKWNDRQNVRTHTNSIYSLLRQLLTGNQHTETCV